MKNAVLCLALLFVLIITPLSSGFLGYFEQDECVNIITISNSSSITLSTVSNNQELTIIETAMEKNGKTFNYTFCNTSETGTYNYDYYDAEGFTFVNNFGVNPLGREFDAGQSNISLGILFGALVVAFLFLIIGLFMWVNQNNSAIGFLFFILSIFFGLYSLHLAYAYSADLLFYDSLTPLVAAIYTTMLWLMTALGLISAMLMLIAFIKELGKINETKEFGPDFDPITQTYDL